MSRNPTFGLGPLPQFPAKEWRGLSQQVEQLGFRTLWIPDERFYRDVVVTLAAIARATTTLQIGVSVTDPFVRHPALTAQWSASLDELSGGRMNVGIGAGIAGFSALGITRHRPMTAIREMVELMRQLWEGGVIDYQGETVQFHKTGLDFKPIRERIPCYVAGRGPLILKLAGEIGEGVILGSLAAEGGVRYAFDHIDQGLRSAGRSRDDLDVAIWLHTAVAPNREQARAAVRMIVVGVLLSSRPILDQLGVPIDAELEAALEGVRYVHGSPEMMQVAAMLPDEIVDQFAVAGSPAEVAERIQQLHNAGVNHFALKPWLVPDQALVDFSQIVAKEVMPRVQ